LVVRLSPPLANHEALRFIIAMPCVTVVVGYGPVAPAMWDASLTAGQ